MARKTKIAEKVRGAEGRLEKLRAKHSSWDPRDNRSMNAWAKQLSNIKHEAEFAEQPTIKKFIRYMISADAEIKQILLTDRELPNNTEQHRILLEKREFIKAWMEIFIPSEAVVEAMSDEIDFQLSDMNINTKPLSTYKG